MFKFSNIKIKHSGNDNNLKAILLVTYHPLLKSLKAIINNLSLLYIDNDVKRVFTS